MIKARQVLIGGGIAAAAITGGAVGATLFGSAQAATVSSTTSTSTPATTDRTHDHSEGGHVGANGVKEVVLTGAAATKAKAAALAAVPGGTVERVETDAEGAKYEAHMTKADGSDVTVKIDAAFKVTGVETGHGR